jgi:hypothetical protein
VDQEVKLILAAVSAVGAIAGVLSGIFWVLAAKAKVSAGPDANEGVGFDGSPVNVKDHGGDVIDFLRSYRLQSKWNSRAAYAAAAAAAMAALYFTLTVLTEIGHR